MKRMNSAQVAAAVRAVANGYGLQAGQMLVPNAFAAAQAHECLKLSELRKISEADRAAFMTAQLEHCAGHPVQDGQPPNPPLDITQCQTTLIPVDEGDDKFSLVVLRNTANAGQQATWEMLYLNPLGERDAATTDLLKAALGARIGGGANIAINQIAISQTKTAADSAVCTVANAKKFVAVGGAVNAATFTKPTAAEQGEAAQAVNADPQLAEAFVNILDDRRVLTVNTVQPGRVDFSLGFHDEIACNTFISNLPAGVYQRDELTAPNVASFSVASQADLENLDDATKAELDSVAAVAFVHPEPTLELRRYLNGEQKELETVTEYQNACNEYNARRAYRFATEGEEALDEATNPEQYRKEMLQDQQAGRIALEDVLKRYGESLDAKIKLAEADVAVKSKKLAEAQQLPENLQNALKRQQQRLQELRKRKQKFEQQKAALLASYASITAFDVTRRVAVEEFTGKDVATTEVARETIHGGLDTILQELESKTKDSRVLGLNALAQLDGLPKVMIVKDSATGKHSGFVNFSKGKVSVDDAHRLIAGLIATGERGTLEVNSRGRAMTLESKQMFAALAHIYGREIIVDKIPGSQFFGADKTVDDFINKDTTLRAIRNSFAKTRAAMRNTVIDKHRGLLGDNQVNIDAWKTNRAGAITGLVTAAWPNRSIANVVADGSPRKQERREVYRQHLIERVKAWVEQQVALAPVPANEKSVVRRELLEEVYTQLFTGADTKTKAETMEALGLEVVTDDYVAKPNPANVLQYQRNAEILAELCRRSQATQDANQKAQYLKEAKELFAQTAEGEADSTKVTATLNYLTAQLGNSDGRDFVDAQDVNTLKTVSSIATPKQMVAVYGDGHAKLQAHLQLLQDEGDKTNIAGPLFAQYCRDHSGEAQNILDSAQAWTPKLLLNAAKADMASVANVLRSKDVAEQVTLMRGVMAEVEQANSNGTTPAFTQQANGLFTSWAKKKAGELDGAVNVDARRPKLDALLIKIQTDSGDKAAAQMSLVAQYLGLQSAEHLLAYMRTSGAQGAQSAAHDGFKAAVEQLYAGRVSAPAPISFDASSSPVVPGHRG